MLHFRDCVFGVLMTTAAVYNVAEQGAMNAVWHMDDPRAVEETVGTLPRAMYASFNMMMGSFDAVTTRPHARVALLHPS